MSYAPLVSGTLAAHALAKGARLVLEAADGQPVIGISRGSEHFSASFEAADGAWTMLGMNASTWSGPASYSVTDASGAEIATLAKGRTERSMELPSGPAVWEYHAVRSPHYRVEGLFNADRKPLHKFAPGLSRRPFTVEVTDALTARPDASLLLLLATWCTNNHIVSKVDSAGG